MENKLYTTGKVAEILDIPKQTIGRWVREGKINPIQITDTGRYLFSVEQIEQFKNGTLNQKTEQTDNQNGTSEHKNGQTENEAVSIVLCK